MRKKTTSSCVKDVELETTDNDDLDLSEEILQIQQYGWRRDMVAR